MFPVYLITCFHPDYGAHVMPYVGCTSKTVQQRFEKHLSGKGNAVYLRNAIKKYGREWFQIEQIDAGNTKNQALELEEWWVRRLGTKAPNGYNVKDGGAGIDSEIIAAANRRRWADPTNREQMSRKMTGNTNNDGRTWSHGYRLTEAQKAKISATHKGVKRPEHSAWMKAHRLKGTPHGYK
jgi:predicted GIY-YIG superfamily endonuclease